MKGKKMAYAWSQLQRAVKAIEGGDNKRAGLIRAFIKLSTLRLKDLPAEARQDFTDLTDRVRAYQWDKINTEEVKKHVTSLTDAEVTAAISKIIAMRDALACYQPLPRRVAVTKRPTFFGGHTYC
jgi:hypothetical protein